MLVVFGGLAMLLWSLVVAGGMLVVVMYAKCVLGQSKHFNV